MGSIDPSVPIVDISSFTSVTPSTPESRHHDANALAAALRISGCVGLTGHGIPASTLSRAFQISKQMFDLPYEDKMKAPHPDGMVPHRGYSGVGREKGAAKTALETEDEEEKEEYLGVGDLKESYEIGSEENKMQYNIWLPEDVLPGFRKFMTELFWDLNKTTEAIMEALIESLELTEEEGKTVRKMHSGHENQLRLLHYPPISKEMLENREIGRLGAHTDWSLFNLLFQPDWLDGQGGLEFGDPKTGEFMPATPMEGVVYMNIGDMFSRVSNGIYPSGLHRVVIPGKASGEATPARYSIPYFTAPPPDMMLGPPPSLVAKSGKRVFEPVTFNEYSEMMFQATQLRE